MNTLTPENKLKSLELALGYLSVNYSQGFDISILLKLADTFGDFSLDKPVSDEILLFFQEQLHQNASSDSEEDEDWNMGN